MENLRREYPRLYVLYSIYWHDSCCVGKDLNISITYYYFEGFLV